MMETQVIEATEFACSHCGNEVVSVFGAQCATCQQKLEALAIDALTFSSRLDPTDASHRVIEIHQLEDMPRTDYYVTGDAARLAIAMFCLGQLAGMGVIPDDVAVMLAKYIGNLPPSEPLPWAQPATQVVPS